MKRKILLSAVCLLIIATACCTLFGCDLGKKSDSEKTVKFLVLGDSIGEAVLGPSPLEARDLYSYCSLIGEVNNYDYHNRAVSGHKSDRFLEYISVDKDENAYTVITHIKEADIIDISMMGNDLLQTGINQFARDAIDGDYSRAEEILAQSYLNISAAIARIYELNPDVTLIFQTLYNPLFADSIMFSDAIKAEMQEKGIDAYAIGKQLIDRLNNNVFRYAEEHPNTIIIADVNKKFDEAYQKGAVYLDRYMYADCVHPSNEGHAAIFTVIQTVLEEKGLADHDSAIKSYKSIVCDRLKTLYKGTDVDVNKVSKDIKNASTYQEINDIYFDATLDVAPKY